MRIAPPDYLIWVFAFVLLTTSAPSTLSLEDGRIGVLYVGCIARAQPFWMMRSDPLFRITFVQATIRDFMSYGPMPAMSEADVHRMVRLYMPRTLTYLVDNFDVTVLFEANIYAVGPHIDKLAKGTYEGGLGMMMAGGWQSFGAFAGYSPWGETSVGQLLPTEDVLSTWDESMVQRLVIDEPDNELISSIPWNKNDPALSGGIWHHNRVTVRPGAELLAHVESGSGYDDPLMVTWELPNGPRTFSLTSESCRLVAIWANRWEFAYDYASNLMIYLDDRPVPQDIALVHAARSKMFEVNTKRSLLSTLVEFCESFGANTQGMIERFEEMDAVISEALPHYFELRFDEMLETYREVDGMLEQAEDEAVKLKNRTLFWVFVIEWFVVTGTIMACGFVLWSLMIRRRLYREIRTTRFLDQRPG